MIALHETQYIAVDMLYTCCARRTYMVSVVMCVTRVKNDFKQVEHVKSNADDNTFDEVAILVVI